MARFQDQITDEHLHPVGNAEIWVFDAAGPNDGQQAVLTADGGGPLPQPLLSDANGIFYYNAADNLYENHIHYGGQLRYVQQASVGTAIGTELDGDRGDIIVSGAGTDWQLDAGVVGTNELANGAVTLAKMANVATARILGRATTGTGVPEALTGTQATALLDTVTSGLKGLAPPSGGGTANYLRADGSWAVPPGLITTITWGNITGTLSAQADLQAALDAKASTAAMNSALALKYDKVGGTITGNVTVTAANPSIIVNPSSGQSAFYMRETLDTQDGLLLILSTSLHGAMWRCDTTAFYNRAGTQERLLFDATGITAKVPFKVIDEAYGAAWDGKLEPPTKNAVYDKIQASLGIVTASTPGLAPASGGGAVNFLRADGTWATPATDVGTVAWGAITGTIANQGDLNTALNAKANLAGAAFTGGVSTTSSLTSFAGTIVNQGPAGSNVIYRLRDENSLNQGLLWWERSTDLIHLQRYGADGSSVEGRITLSATAITASLPVVVPAEVYGPSWSGKQEAATKDAIWDKIDSLVAPVWGAISGTLADQADLQTALNAKANLAGNQTFTGTITIGNGLIASNGSVVSQASGAGNAQFSLKDDAALNQFILFWDRASDSIRLRRYNAAGSAAEGEIQINATTISSTLDFAAPSLTINGVPWVASSATRAWNAVGYIGASGTMEVGARLDFHTAENDGTDRQARIAVTGTKLELTAASGITLNGASIQTVSPMSHGAIGDGVANDETALNTALDTAAALNTWVDGEGKSYGVAGIWATGARVVRLRNCTLKQLTTSATTDNKNLHSVNSPLVYLENVRIDLGANGANGGLFTAAGVYITGCTDVLLRNVEVFGNTKGSCIAIFNSARCYLDRCYVHDVTAGSSGHAVMTDDVLQGILIQACDQAEIHAPRVENLRSLWTGQAVITRWSRGLAFAGVKDFTVIGPQIENCDQGCDITGDLGNYRWSIHGGSANNCYSFGFKAANTGAYGSYHGCRAYRCGYSGFIASGPSASVGSETMTAEIEYFGCIAIETGYGNVWAPTATTAGFRIMNTSFATAKPDGIQYWGCKAIAAGAPMKYGFFSDSVAPVAANRMIYCRSVGHTIGISSGLTVV